METALTLMIGAVIGLFVNYLSDTFSQCMDSIFEFLFHMFNPEKFDLTGKWEYKFSEPKANNPGEWVEESEKVILKHIGNKLTGTGRTTALVRVFNYVCSVRHNMVFGSYTKVSEKGNITGNGVIQLIVSPDRLSMKGQATWLDTDTNLVESSECIWKKI